MLPINKDDFPKCLYLDQNKWIDLARAHYGRGDGKAFKPALEAVEEAVKSGKLIVPISGVHVLETIAAEDAGRRKRLAQFMVDISKNITMPPPLAYRTKEIAQAISAQLGLGQSIHVRPNLLARGIANSLGGQIQITGLPADKVEELMKKAESSEATVEVLVSMGDSETVKSGKAEDVTAANLIESIRNESLEIYDDDMKHKIELASIFTKGLLSQDLLMALKHLGLKIDDLFNTLNSPEETVEFFHAIPFVDVFITLGLCRDREAQREIHRNDAKDMEFLAGAIPYCNVVITEKYWAHVARKEKLDLKYDVIIEKDAKKIPDILEDMGCL